MATTTITTTTTRSCCANQLFVDYLAQLEQSAIANERVVLASAYRKAIESLRLFPVPLASGAEAMMLQGVGPHVAQKLDQLVASIQKKNHKSAALKRKQPLSAAAVAPPAKRAKTLALDVAVSDSENENPNQQRDATYRPKRLSIPWAILRSLYQTPDVPCGKLELSLRIQQALQVLLAVHIIMRLLARARAH